MTRRHMISSLAVSTLPVVASEPYRLDLHQQDLADQGGTPDHLEPTTINVPTVPCLAQYASFPSFKGGNYLMVDPPTTAHEFSMRACDLSGSPKLTKPPTETIRLRIDRELASAIYDLWANALFEVRYPKSAYRGVDGCTHVFTSFVRGLGYMHGSIWSPMTDVPPTWLVEIAESLTAVTLTGGNGLEKAKANVIRTRDRYFTYIQDHGLH